MCELVCGLQHNKRVLLPTHPSAQSLAPEMARLTSATAHCSLSTSHAMTGPETRRATEIAFGMLYTSCLVHPVSPKVCTCAIYVDVTSSSSFASHALGLMHLAPVFLGDPQKHLPLLASYCSTASTAQNCLQLRTRHGHRLKRALHAEGKLSSSPVLAPLKDEWAQPCSLERASLYGCFGCVVELEACSCKLCAVLPL